MLNVLLNMHQDGRTTSDEFKVENPVNPGRHLGSGCAPSGAPVFGFFWLGH